MIVRRILSGTLCVVVCVAGATVLPGCPVGRKGPSVSPRQAYVDARTALLQAADDESPVTRANAIEALGETLGLQAGHIFTQALSDPNPAVRFSAAMVVGDLKYAGAKRKLTAMATDKESEPDRRVLCAVIYALYRLGDDRHAGQLGKLLFDKEEEVRANAAMAMGKMGEPSAIGPLRNLLSDEQKVKVKWQVRESLAMLGDKGSALTLQACAREPDIQLRLAAISAMARVPGDLAPAALKELLEKRNPPRVRVAAAGALAGLGHSDKAAYKLCLESLKDPESVLRRLGDDTERITAGRIASLRQLAAKSLGRMRHVEAVDVLHPQVVGRQGPVRVAAAMSILQLLSASPVRGAGGAEGSGAKEPQTWRPRGVGPAKLHTAGGKD